MEAFGIRTYYFTPFVFVPAVLGALAVWWQNPKKKKQQNNVWRQNTGEKKMPDCSVGYSAR